MYPADNPHTTTACFAQSCSSTSQHCNRGRQCYSNPWWWWEKGRECLSLSNLAEARTILHQIAGTAGSLGFDDLGTVARDNELAIDAHLDGPKGKIANCPTEIIFGLDDFLKSSEALIAEQSALESQGPIV